MWNIEQAVEFCRMIEPVAIAEGFHVALGGSVLIRGESKKDVDIFIYPHKTEHATKTAFDCLIEKFENLGVNNFKQADHKAYADNKLVFWSEYNGKRVDWFFLK